MGRTIGSSLRTALVVVLPFATLVPILSKDVAGVLFDAGAGDPGAFAPTLALFGPALVFFTVHYLMLRGFYALEQTRLVFYVQCVISATNIVVAFALVGQASPEQTAPALVVAWLVSYVVGSALSYAAAAPHARRPPDPGPGALPRSGWSSPAPAPDSPPGRSSRPSAGLGEQPGILLSLLRGGLAGLAGGVVLLVIARLLRVREITSLTDAALARLRRR